MPKIEVVKRDTGEVEQLDLVDAINASWSSSDPGVGKAFLLPDGSEVLNPVPMAPPVGFEVGPTMLEQFEAKMAARFRMLQEDEEIDSAEDWDDFDIGDDVEPPPSPYELVMVDEVPALPPSPPDVVEPDLPDPPPLPPKMRNKKPASQDGRTHINKPPVDEERDPPDDR